MKLLSRLSLMVSMLSLLALQSHAVECTIDVRATDTTGKGGTLTLNLNSVPAEFRSIGLLGGGTRDLTLVAGTDSPSSMTLKAQVGQETGSASCEAAISQCAKMDLTISMAAPASCSTTPPADEEEACKHDNGNHWGEYRKLGQVVPPHSGKPNATKPCKDSKKSPSTTPNTPTQSCPAQLTCAFSLTQF